MLIAGACTSILRAQSTTASPMSPTVTTSTNQSIEGAIERANAAIAKIVAIADKDHTFENTITPIDDLLARFESETSMLVFMSNVHPDAGVRAASQGAEETASNYFVELSKREDLYKAVKAYADGRGTLEKRTGEEARLLSFLLRDYKRSGLDLPKAQRDKLAEIQKEIGKLGIEFNKNIAEDEGVVMLTQSELEGVPQELVESLSHNAGVYAVGLSYPIYTPVMETCTVEATRQKMWMAYKRRAGKKNVAVLEHAIKLRADAATMLGYPHCAAYEIETRMAKNYETVQKFYETLRPLVRVKAQQDFDQFTAAKREITKDTNATLKPWDFFYIKNQLLQSKYAVDTEKVREYFPMQAVVDGLFSVTQSLYGLEYKDVTATKAGTSQRPLWHPDVKLYEVYDKSTGSMIGEFYLDLYPRENKYSHAAQWSLVNHKVWSDGKVTTPLAALVCNFTKPTPDKPSLLQHEEVETFFHEFGHCLHTILSTAKFNRFAGTNTELDFVEAPSQMFENWVWNEEVLSTFARHYKSGEKLPKALLDGMIAAKNLGSGIDAENQFYYALTDLALETTSDGKVDSTTIATDLYPQVQLYDFRPEGTFYHASFGHLMGYQAGYYSYMWSLVYASDMFQRFKELGMLNPEAGKYYRDKIISQGGTRDSIDLVKDYLGREPKLDAFLAQLGLAPQTRK
jgi:thimet oligopeptidase